MTALVSFLVTLLAFAFLFVVFGVLGSGERAKPCAGRELRVSCGVGPVQLRRRGFPPRRGVRGSTPPGPSDRARGATCREVGGGYPAADDETIVAAPQTVTATGAGAAPLGSRCVSPGTCPPSRPASPECSAGSPRGTVPPWSGLPPFRGFRH